MNVQNQTKEIGDKLLKFTMKVIPHNKAAFWQAFVDIQKDVKSSNKNFHLIKDKYAKEFYKSI